MTRRGHFTGRVRMEIPSRREGLFFIPIFVVFLYVSAAVAQQAATCVTCHKTQEGEIQGSVHSSLNCQECHGGNEAYDVSAGILSNYLQGSEGSRPPFDHGDSYQGKPERKKIPQLCGDCHADVARMNPFGLRTDQLMRYKTSGHGLTLEKTGDDRVAVCIDCHGIHDILAQNEPASKTNPKNIPDMCASCHSDASLMAEYDLPTGVVDEYRQSIHGKLLLEEGDTGAPNCATCHGNHAAIPPGFSSVGSVCGKCHVDARDAMAATDHAEQEDFKGCVQCHAAAEGGHHHLIERITQPVDVLVERYAAFEALKATGEEIDEKDQVFRGPRRLLDQAMHGCLDCHEEVDEDESLQGMLSIFSSIVEGESAFAKTAKRLEQASEGVLLVDDQLFRFEDARTHLIGLASAQHTLDKDSLEEKANELQAICAEIDAQLDELDEGLAMRRKALIPIWVFSILFAAVLYTKFKQLKRQYVKV